MFELLFIACFLATVISLAWAAYFACRRRWASSVRVLRRLGHGVAIYTALLVVVSLTSDPTFLTIGEVRRFDEWGLSVEQVTRQPQVGTFPSVAEARGIFSVVKIRVSNAATRRAQGASDVGVSLIDLVGGDRYDPSPEGQHAMDAMGASGPALSTKMPPGGSFERSVVFDVPKAATDLGLLVSHGSFPGLLIIGDSQSFLHPPTVIKLTDSKSR